MEGVLFITPLIDCDQVIGNTNANRPWSCGNKTTHTMSFLSKYKDLRSGQRDRALDVWREDFLCPQLTIIICFGGIFSCSPNIYSEKH